MLTVLEALNKSTEYLKTKGITSPRINAELLLSNVLKCDKLNLYLSFDKPLEETEISTYRKLILRRSKFEPLQYILGKVEFYGMEFKVNNHVLIPRQETEILVETIISNHKNDKVKILDIGSGSGNIALVLAKNIENADITSIDISEEAIMIAEENCIIHDVNKSVHFKQFDVFDEFSKSGITNIDIIVSNPPYIDVNEYEKLQREIVDYEPRNALTDEGDGLKYYQRISSLSSEILKSGGRIYFEIGHDQKNLIFDILHNDGFINIEVIKDYSDKDRVIEGVKP